MIKKKCYLIYPCGKKFEIKIPIAIKDDNGLSYSILPGACNYFQYAKQKFQINNLKVIEEDSFDTAPAYTAPFISLTKKIRCVE